MKLAGHINDKCCMILLIRSTQSSPLHRDRKQKCGRGVARGWREEGMVNDCLMGRESQFPIIEGVLDIDSGDDGTVV